MFTCLFHSHTFLSTKVLDLDLVLVLSRKQLNFITQEFFFVESEQVFYSILFIQYNNFMHTRYGSCVQKMCILFTQGFNKSMQDRIWILFTLGFCVSEMWILLAQDNYLQDIGSFSNKIITCVLMIQIFVCLFCAHFIFILFAQYNNFYGQDVDPFT